MKFLEGKKTYIGIALLFILGGLKAVGVVDQNIYDALEPIFLGWTAFGIYKKK